MGKKAPENWAVVVGIDQYWSEEACLRGAVNDACRMREWLLKPDGGNVPEDNLFLVISPRSNFRAINKATQQRLKASGLLIEPADRSNIQGAIALVEQQYGGTGNRFFFHYSGHGLSYLNRKLESSAIAPSDLKPGLGNVFDTGVLIDLSTMIEYIKMLKFKEQFFFIDACRNIPWKKEFWNGNFSPGEFSGTRSIDSKKPPYPLPNQIVFHATSPGLLANEITLKNREVGAFTEALLEGLSGNINSAKVYETGSDTYLVTDASLHKYIKEIVENRKLRATLDEREIIQHPSRRYEGSDNTIILTFDSKKFKELDLDVLLDPAIARSEATIAVFLAKHTHKIEVKPKSLPVNFKVMPGNYGLVVTADNYVAEPEREPIEVWGPTRTTVKLHRHRGAAKKIHSLLPLKTKGMRSARDKVMLTVLCSDEAGALEIADSTGKVLSTGSSPLTKDLPPGFYQARLVGPEGQLASKDVILTVGRPETVRLTPPEPPGGDGLRTEIIERAKFHVGIGESKNLLGVSEQFVGRIAYPQLSTILSLAGTASTFDRSEWNAHRLRELGMTTFADKMSSDELTRNTSGLQVLFAFDSNHESDAEKSVGQTRVELYGLKEKQAGEFVSVSNIPGLGSYSQATQAGNYKLSVMLPGLKALQFYLTLLPGRLTLLVFHQKASGELRVFQYMPKIKNTNVVREALFTRRLDLLQRFYISGQFDHALHGAKEMLMAKWEDPIFGCVGGYLMLRLGESRYLAQAVFNMIREYPELADSHLLMAEFHASQGKHASAKAEYKRTIRTGIPIFSDGLTLLSQAATRYRIEEISSLKSVLDNHLKGLLWSTSQ